MCHSVFDFEVELFLFFVLIYCVVDSEDVFRVQALLQTFVHLVIQLVISLVHESFSEFADAMMMRNATTVLEHGVSRLILDILVNFNDLFLWVLIIPDREVNINRSTRLIQLRHTEAAKHISSVLTM